MKKIIMKVGLIIMALTTMVTMNACSKINNDTVNDVCAALSEKYGESFIAVKIGDRLNTDHAKLYVYPGSNNTLLFTATINRDTRIVVDDYVEQKVNHKVDTVIAEAATREDLAAYANCCIITRETLDAEIAEWTPQLFQQKYNFENYLVYLCVNKNDLTAEKLYKTMVECSAELGITVRYRVYVLEASKFDECVAELQKMPDANSTVIEKFAPIKTIWNDVDNGVSSNTINDLENVLQEV